MIAKKQNGGVFFVRFCQLHKWLELLYFVFEKIRNYYQVLQNFKWNSNIIFRYDKLLFFNVFIRIIKLKE